MRNSYLSTLSLSFLIFFSAFGQKHEPRQEHPLKEVEKETIISKDARSQRTSVTTKNAPIAISKKNISKQGAASALGKGQMNHLEDDPQARMDFEILRTRNPKTGEVPEDIRMKELEFMRSQAHARGIPTAAGDNTVQWYNRGPRNVGGRTRALAVDMNNEDVILAGGVSGGMWRSTDQGVSWSKTTGSDELQSVTCIAQDPTQPTTWYYGTGEMSGNSASGAGAYYFGDGIYKSTDNGITWEPLQSTVSETPETFELFDIINEIVVNPANGDLLVATFFGLYRSQDGGATFSEVLPHPAVGWSDVVATNAGVLYAVSQASAISQSIDNGDSWITVAGAPLASGRMELALAPSNQDILYAIGEGDVVYQLWKFDDSDDSWTDLSTNIPQHGGLTGDFDSQGGYDLLIKVKPEDENFVVIGGRNLWRSTDGFATSGNTTWIGGYTAENDTYASYPDHHPDQHAFVFLSGNEALSGNDGGVQITSDITTTLSAFEAVDWTPLNNGYLTTQVYAVSTGPGDQIMAGFQDNGTWLTTSTDGSVDWSFPFGGDGAYSAFNSTGTERFVSSQFGNIYRLGYSSADDASEDYFQYFTPSGYNAELFIVPFYLDPLNDNLFYLGGSGSLYFNSQAMTGSDQVGWESIELSTSDVISEIGVTRNNIVYAGTAFGELFKLTGLGEGGSISFGQITGSNFPNGYISGIGVNQLNPNELLVCFSNYEIPSVFHSTDGGQTWADISGSLEENPDGSGSGPSVRHVQILGNGDRYFAATSTGLYSTTSLSGATTSWEQENSSGMGNVVVEHLVARPEDGLVVAGTHGNGVFSAEFEVSGPPDVDLAVSSIPAPTSGALTTSETVIAEIFNLGAQDQTGFMVSLEVNGSHVITDVVNSTVTPGQYYEHQFSTSVDLSAIGDYEFVVVVFQTGDENPANDSFSKTVASIETISTFPYAESFESADHGWNVVGGVWELGTPIKANLNGAFDGTQAWATDLDSDYPNDALAILESPVFDLSELSSVEISMALNYETELDWDGAVLGYRIDSESGYFAVPDEMGISNWYNATINSLGIPGWTGSTEGTYVDASASLDFLAEQPFVQFALLFSSDESITDEGIAMDAFELRGPPSYDLSVTTISEPHGGVRGLEYTTATVTSLGSEPVSEFEIAYFVDGVEIETLQVTLDDPLNYADQVEITFPTQYDFSSPGTHVVEVRVSLETDEVSGNDSFSKEVFNLAIQGFYQMEQITEPTIGVAAEFADGKVFSATGLSTIYIDIIDENTRQFEIKYVSHVLGADNSKNYMFTLENGNVIFGDDQETNVFCTGGGIFLGSADTPGSYDPVDDSEFTLTLKENVTQECDVDAVDITFRLVKVDDDNLHQPDVDALLALHNSTNGDNWDTSWDLDNSPLTWRGVTFSPEGRVVDLNLSANDLNGDIPAELWSLTELIGLSLGNNGQLNGVIPPEVQNLSKLERMDLRITSLSGTIPVEVGELSNLVLLDLSTNQISGEIPSTIGNLSNLERLDLNGNNLTGLIPSSLGNLENLERLDLSQNDLSGSIPTSLGNLQNLEFLRLGFNLLDGQIPAELGNLSNLILMNLRYNQLDAAVPTSFASLANLEAFDVSDNQLEGLPDLSVLPLQAFYVYNNRLNFGDIIPNVSTLTWYTPQADLETEIITVAIGSPIDLEVVTSDDGTNIYQWYKDGIWLSGETSSTLSFTYEDGDAGEYRCLILNPSASQLELKKHFLVADESVATHPDYEALEAFYFATGGENWTDNDGWLVSPDLSTWYGLVLNANGRVSEVYLNGNNLKGAIPPEIGDLSELQTLRLAHNELFGQLPSEIGNLQNLEELLIAFSGLTGEIPESIGNLSSITHLYFGGNSLMGLIPATVGSLTNLVVFGAPNNDLFGEIPSEFGNLPNLERLGLRNNNFSGEVPASLASSSNLTHLNVHENNISGLPNLSALTLTSFQVQNNALGFEDIIANIPTLTAYAPQQSIDLMEESEVTRGEEYTMQVSDLTAGNSYQWLHNGSPVSGATNSSYTITDFNDADVGVYTCEVTNSAAPLLTLVRNPVLLSIVEVVLSLQADALEIDENSTSGSLVSSFFIENTENDDEFSYTLGGADADSFVLGGTNGRDLSTVGEFDFEERSVYNISISANRGIVTLIEDFDILIRDLPEPPSQIFLDGDAIEENLPPTTVVALLMVDDEDFEDSHTFNLGGTDALSFEILGDQLLSTESFDFESKNSYDITIEASDVAGLSLSTDFTLSILDITPEPAKDIILSNSSIEEGQQAGTLIGSLTVTDDDVNDTHTFTLSGVDAADFQISSNELQSANQFDFDVKENYEVTITAIDAGGLPFVKDFTITITEVLGIGNLESELVSIYPNPANTYLKVVVDASLIGATWRITDLTGKVIVNGNRIDKSSEALIDVSGFHAGTYFVTVDANQGSVTKRILISD